MNSAVRGSGESSASLAHVRSIAGTPATPIVPVAVSTTTSSIAASSRSATSCLALSTSASVALWTADPPICSDRDPPVPPPRGTQVGITVDEGDAIDRDAGLFCDEHREGRLMPLAVRRGAGEDRRRAICMHLDRAEFARSATGGDLDVDRDADAEQAAVTTVAPHALLCA